MIKLNLLSFLILTSSFGLYASEEALVGGDVSFASELSETFDDGGFASRVEGRVGQVLTNVRRIVWAPGGLCYWVIFTDDTAQIYLPATSKTGQVLTNVRQISWAPDGQHAWIIFKDGTARLYGPQGFFGEILTNVRWVRWGGVSSGLAYWVIFNDHTARYYNMVQGALGEILTNVKYIYWSPNGSQYLVLLRDHTSQMYNLFDFTKV